MQLKHLGNLKIYSLTVITSILLIDYTQLYGFMTAIKSIMITDW